MRKIKIEYIKEYSLKDGTKCHSNEYLNNREYLQFECSNNHFYNMRWDNFQQGKRCKECFIKKRSKQRQLTHKEVFNYYKQESYIIHNIYDGCMKHDQLTCPVGHSIKITFHNFKNHNRRCGICFNENNFGKNHSSYNPNREEIPLNRRLRISHTTEWSILNMKYDLKYDKFILNPENYVVDHIIPVSLFCRLFNKYTLDEDQVKEIINQTSNLQLLTWKENYKKSIKGSLFEATQYLINNGIPFEKFLEERKI